jgi:hypothetical protein
MLLQEYHYGRLARGGSGGSPNPTRGLLDLIFSAAAGAGGGGRARPPKAGGDNDTLGRPSFARGHVSSGAAVGERWSDGAALAAVAGAWRGNGGAAELGGEWRRLRRWSFGRESGSRRHPWTRRWRLPAICAAVRGAVPLPAGLDGGGCGGLDSGFHGSDLGHRG